MAGPSEKQSWKEGAAGRKAAGLPSGNFGRLRVDEIEARLSEIPDDTRDLTGRVFGDPLPQRSALFQRAAQGRTLRPVRG